VAFAFSAHATAGEQKPLWEFGMGVGALGFADYRGADTDSVYPVPVPYLIYRGRFFKADKDGIRGLFVHSERVEINLSLNATTPVRSSSRGIRAGMPSLRPALEIGPSVDVHLWKSAQSQVALDLRMPARAAVTLEASPRRIGWLFAPALNLDVTDPGGHQGWTAGLLAGPLFADRRYNDYFYSVAPQFATAARPTYRAAGGYGGTQIILSASKRFDRYWVGGFARYDILSGATFTDSPLVKSNHYWTAGLGIAWMIGKSSQSVDADQ
jgi:outer membrane scaffolding protein for murein synthesis (MipA/OmpV family)